MKRIGRLAAFALAFILILAGCATADRTWVYESEGDRIPAGLYINYILDSYTLAQEKYAEEQTALKEDQPQEEADAQQGITLSEEDLAGGEFSIEDLLLDGFEPEEQVDILTVEVEGIPATAWILNQAHRFAMKHYGLALMCEAQGLTLTPEQDRTASATAEYLYSYASSFFERNGIAESSLRLYAQDQALEEALFLSLYGEDGARAVPVQTLRDKFQAEYAKGEYMMFPKAQAEIPAQEEGGEAQSVESQNEEIRATAEAYLQRFQEGDPIEQLIYDRLLEMNPGDETIEMPAQGSTALIIHQDSINVYGEALGNAIFGGTPGEEPYLMEDDEFYYIIRRLDILATDDDFEEARDGLLRDLHYDDFEQELIEAGQALAVTVNQSALDYYTTDRIDFTFTVNR